MAEEAKSGLTVDEDLIRSLAALLDETALTEIEVQEGERKVRVAKGGSYIAAPATAPASTVPAQGNSLAQPEELAAHPGAITAPMVGVCYLAPDPSSAAFCGVGDSVKEGETVLLIEAMKVFNPISAPKSGTVTAILVSDGTPVEYGEPLIVIE